MADLLGKVECWPDSGLLRVASFSMAFMPEHAIDRGQANHAYPTQIVVRKRGAAGELGRYKLTVRQTNTVFSSGGTFGKPMECHVTEAGDYVLSIELDGKCMAEIPFTATRQASGDAFNPVTRVFLDGPWPHYACLFMPRLSDTEATPVVRTWTRGGLFNKNKSELVSIEVYQGGDLVFVSAPVHKSNLLSDTMWHRSDSPLHFRTGDGGGPIKLRDLLKKDGEYLVVRKRDGSPTGAWKLVIRDGKPIPHPRSNLAFEPAKDRLLSRSPGGQKRGNSDLVWLEEVPMDQAKAVLAKGAAAPTGPTADQRTRWSATRHPHTGPAKLVITDVDCRMDGTLAVSDSVIAYATGGGNGVGFLRIGENTAQSIPNGQSYSGRMFHVCGPKIVLAQRDALAVFDTKSGKTSSIPATEISLTRTFGEMYGANVLAADGHLVATLNNPKRVTDRAMFKVLDVSGDSPRVIVLDNIDVPARDLTCVTVDAESGRFGVVSQRAKKFWIAPIAPGARFTEYDVSGHDGIHRNAQLRIEGDRALYFDETGRPKLRHIDLASKQVAVIGTLGKQMNWFTATPTHVAFVTNQSHGGSYLVKRGGITGPYAGAANSGKPSPGNGDFGFGSSLALTDDGATVLAGQGSGGISTGELLQVDDGKGWAVVANDSGAPLPAVDVRQGPGVIAFKTGSRNETKVAYLITGKRADFSGLKLLR
ncbi:MAG: hypothetical protein KDC87_13055 [Planctomycetes bacterium]|nr:hypothetical protein [Planctomycetota bacterium]MCB9868982.1 hypothetical protein [Planctomycetota bacterium]